MKPQPHILKVIIMTQKGIVPAKDMIITTTGGLWPRMEVRVTRPAYKPPRESDTPFPKNRDQKDDRKMEQEDVQQKD